MPSQIAPPIAYQDGDPINGDAFNQHVSHAVLLDGSITEQTPITTSAIPTVSKDDSIVIYDESEATTNKLRKVTVQQLLNNDGGVTSSEVITPKITAPFWNDIVVTPKVGADHVSRSYYSTDGFVVNVSDPNHGYETGTLVNFYGATFGDYNGTFQITKVDDSNFRYNNGKTVASAAGSGTIHNVKVPTVAVIGNVTINDNLLVAGNTNIAGNAKVSGAVDVGSLTIGGKTPLTAEGNYIGINTKTQHLTNYAWNVIDYQTQSFNVPPGETWTFVWTAVTHFYGDGAGNTRADFPYTWNIRVGSLTGSIVDTIQAGSQPYGGTSTTVRSIVVRNEGTTGNNHTIVSPTVGMTYAGTMNLTWSAIPVNGRNKWNHPLSVINITLYRQKTSTLWYNTSTVL